MEEEIFAVGRWNGIPFSLDDLEKMADSFNKLKEIVKVPLKLGHNDEQPMTDGQPALGWVTEMKVVGQKLVAVFEDVPSIVQEAMSKKLYRGKSIEVDFDVIHKDSKYDFVITAVALLGADIPAVNVLNDLGAFLASRNSILEQGLYKAGRQVSFTLKPSDLQETGRMDEIEELKRRLAASEAEKAELSEKFSKAEASATEAAQRAEALEAAQKKAEVDTARAKFSAMLEKAVTEKVISPAQREAFAKVLRLDDDEAVMKIEEEHVTALIGADDKGTRFSRDTSHQDVDEITGNPGDEITQRAYQHMEKTGEKNFSRSVEIVMRADRELAREYLHSNGEVRT